MLRARFLGAFEISSDGDPVVISSRPAQSLFAYLILNSGTAHRREKLAGLLWPDSLEETARDNLRHALWRMRKALPANGYLLADDLTIAFNDASEYWLDARVLEQVSEEASADELIGALSGYQGELLPGFYDEWVVLEREHLQSVFEHKMARLMALLEGGGRWLDILDWGERWISLGQKPEPAYRALMMAHAAKGDMSKVAATYERCVKSLKEYGIEPSEQTKELYGNLKSAKLLPPARLLPSITIAHQPPTSHIPVPLTSFVGREKELKEIIGLLASVRLLTLTGPGGVGKTRLAIKAANESTGRFREGVYWVSLVALSDANLIPQEIARSLNVPEVPGEPLIETLKTHLKIKKVLLVIDNCEHLVGACAEYIEQLLAACLKIRILATSIEALGLFNETTWQVPSLPLPETVESLSLRELQGYASIELFNERAGYAKLDFVLNEEDARSVAKICQRLDGIPLAIELAAARTKVLSVDEIATRLDNRFSLLTAGSRTAIPRHQTLRATIDWSHDLLTGPERILFRRLSVFVGGFTLKAAEAVCGFGELGQGDILDLLGRLVDKSLVVVVHAPLEDTRYRLLETIREYAGRKMDEAGEAAILRDQHLGFMVSFVGEAEQHTFGAESARYHIRLDQELDDIRAAMEWAIQTHQAAMAFRLGAALYYYLYNRSAVAGDWQRRIRRALRLPEGMQRTADRAQALNGLGFHYWAGINPGNPREELEEALSIGRELGDRAIIARTLYNMGMVESVEASYEKARSLLEQSLGLFREVDSLQLEYILPLIMLGDVAFNQNDLGGATNFYEQGATVLREIGDRNFLAYIVRRLGRIACHRGEYERAAELYRESLTLNRELGDERGVLACLSACAAIAAEKGKATVAAQLFGAVEVLLKSKSMRLLIMDHNEYERNVSSLRQQLGVAAWEKLQAEGAAITMEQGIALALGEALTWATLSM